MFPAGDPQEFTATGALEVPNTVVAFKGFVLTAAAAAAVAVVRKGGASGTVVLTMKAGIETSFCVPLGLLIQGGHVTLTGAGALFYTIK